MSTSYVRTICPFCGVGCGLVLEVRDGEVVRVFGEKEHVLSRGRLCGKGASSIRSLYSKDRIIYPLKRVGDNFITIGYDDAIKEITEKLLDIRDRYGGKSIAIFGGCQNTLGETYIMGKLARFLGSNNVDSCARVCHEPSAMALRETVGIGGSGVSIEEVPRAKVIVIAGESITESHPVLVDYFLEAKRNGAKIIVIDPRVTPTVRLLADMHLQINQGTDIYLFNAVANYLIQSGKYDKEFVESRTKGFEEYREVVRDYSIEDAEKITGIPKDEIVRFAELITTKPTIFSWGLGLSEGGGVNAVRAYLDLMLLTGNVGIDGGGPLVFRGQSNVQGSGDLLKPNRFPNGDINEENARKLAGVWGFEPPLYKGLTVTDTFLRDNDIKAVILFNFNVAHSLPNRDRVIKKLKELELLVVVDAFMNETARYAHYVLPTAMWAEEEGSVVSLDRLIKWRFRAVNPPGDAKPTLQILSDLGAGLGLKIPTDPREVFEEMRRVVPLYGGLDIKEVMDHSANSRFPNRELVLYKDRFLTPDGFAHFRPVRYVDRVRNGLVLITGRVVTHFNTDTLTGRQGLSKLEEVVYINEEDARRLGIRDGDMVKVVSGCGEVIVRARLSRDVKVGHAFMVNSLSITNNVVCDELDEESRIPLYKSTVVNITPIHP